MKTLVACAMGVVAALASTPARADFTAVGSASGSEPSVEQILDTLYGDGSFSGVDWTNGTVSATRVHDYVTGGDPLNPGPDNNLVANGGTDQIWTDGVASFQGRVRFAGYSQRFGIDYGAGGTTGPDGSIAGPLDTQLLDVIGSGYDAALSGTLTAGFDFTSGDRWGWYRDGTTTNFSAALYNPDAAPFFEGSDHMITYRITGLSDPDLADQTVWLLFWDDQSYPRTDRDFNDLVVQVSASVVPAPGAFLLGALGIGLIGVGKRWLR